MRCQSKDQVDRRSVEESNLTAVGIAEIGVRTALRNNSALVGKDRSTLRGQGGFITTVARRVPYCRLT